MIHIFATGWGQKQGDAWLCFLHFSRPLDPGILIVTLIGFWNTEHTSFKGSKDGLESSPWLSFWIYSWKSVIGKVTQGWIPSTSPQRRLLLDPIH